MTYPKIPKDLIRKVQRTGYGYVSSDYMYRLFRYKKTPYPKPESQRWLLSKPDGTYEFFETMLAGRLRIKELQEEYYESIKDI